METRRQTESQSNASDSASSTKKRKPRSTPSADDLSGDDGKKRGRPRVEKPDESAADRRRTQIRMAQRAYRQRKESTLEELRSRVTELTKTMELMHKAFLDHRERLCRADLNQRQTEEVCETANQLEAILKGVRNSNEDNPDEPPKRLHRESFSSVRGATSEVPRPILLEPQNVPSWIDRSALCSQPRQRDPHTVGMGYTLYMEDASGNSSAQHEYFHGFDANALLPSLLPSLRLPFHQQQQEQQEQQQQQQSSPPHNYNAFRADLPEVRMAQDLSPPQTYSFQETTFGRRLHRGAIEQAYRLLLDPSRGPATYERVFRLILINSSREKAMDIMKRVLSAGPHDPLINETGSIHIGGAGTHYPRRDEYGNLQPKKESWHMGIVGPQTLTLLENAVKDNITVDMTVDIAGFEGEWFDPYDVEGYLAEKGIYIDPSSSFAEAEVVLQTEAPSSGRITELLPQSSSTAPSSVPTQSPSFQSTGGPRPFDAEQLSHLNAQGVDPSIHDKPWTSFSSNTVGYSDASTGSWMNFMQPGEGLKSYQPATAPTPSWIGSKSTEGLGKSDVGQPPVFLSKATEGNLGGRRKRIIVDVTKFLQLLVTSGVCLSRSPGYKRSDVDRALTLASFDAY